MVRPLIKYQRSVDREERAAPFLSISCWGSESIKSSIIEVIVLSLRAAYKRNLFNLLSLILKFNPLFFIESTQRLRIHVNIALGR